MTDLGTHRPPYVPTGRPIPRFVVALVGLAVLFGALGWSGMVAPRLSLGDTQDGSYDLASGRVTANLDLHNLSLVAVDVRGATLGDGRLKVDSVRVNGRDIATGGQRVAGRGVATMVIEFACRPGEGDDRSLGAAPGQHVDRPRDQGREELDITVRTPIGLVRTRTAGKVQLFAACLN